LLEEYPPGVAAFVSIQDGYVHCQWAPGGAVPEQIIDFAYRLAREEGCLAVENGRQIAYPPEAARAQAEMWDALVRCTEEFKQAAQRSS
jgi:hypothetical protein